MSDDIKPPSDEFELPPSLKFLRQLVTVLTAVMIVGVVTVVVLLVIQLRTPQTNFPDTLIIPDGAKVTAFTTGKDWHAVVTAEDQILILNQDGTVRQTIQVQSQ